jgi:predicted small secreted protein
MIAAESALRIAHERIRNDITIPPECKPAVSLQDDKYIVTYPFALPPGWRGPDYHARVVVDAQTGSVLEVLAAP